MQGRSDYKPPNLHDKNIGRFQINQVSNSSEKSLGSATQIKIDKLT